MSINRIIKSVLRMWVGIVMILVLSLPQSSAHADTYTVNNTNDSGAGSLRQAIANANAHVGEDTIYFNIPLTDGGYDPVTGVFEINLTFGSLIISDDRTDIRGDSQADNQGNTNADGLEIAINGGDLDNPVFSISSDQNELISLAINEGSAGVELTNDANYNLINNCNIGLDADETAIIGNVNGIYASEGSDSNSFIYNVIAGNSSYGVALVNSDDNKLTYSEVGINRAGVCFGNGVDGVILAGSSMGNIIGGNESARNVISCNSRSGVRADGVAGNEISYNHIGTSYFGSNDRGNLQNGVYVVNGADDVLISNNLISGNDQHGVYIYGAGIQRTNVLSNRIGSNASADAILANNWHGVAVYDGPTSSVVADNIIVGNGWSGLVIQNALNNFSESNRIGIGYDPANISLGNSYYGMHLLGNYNRSDYDTIAYNGDDGIRVDGTTYSAIGNFINHSSIFANGSMGINNINGGNSDYVGPVLDVASTCTHLVGDVPAAVGYHHYVQIFSGPDDEGMIYLGSVYTDLTGHFEWYGYLSETYATVNWTNSNSGSTSEFSVMTVPTCYQSYLPVTRRP